MLYAKRRISGDAIMNGLLLYLFTLFFMVMGIVFLYSLVLNFYLHGFSIIIFGISLAGLAFSINALNIIRKKLEEVSK